MKKRTTSGGNVDSGGTMDGKITDIEREFL